jgi:hypothetical protein
MPHLNCAASPEVFAQHPAYRRGRAVLSAERPQQNME